MLQLLFRNTHTHSGEEGRKKKDETNVGKLMNLDRCTREFLVWLLKYFYVST